MRQSCIREAIHETAPICAPRNRDCFDHRVVGRCAGIRIGRLRTEPASQQCDGPLHLRRSESILVPAPYRSYRGSRAEWQHGLHPVIRRGSTASVGRAKAPTGPREARPDDRLRAVSTRPDKRRKTVWASRSLEGRQPRRSGCILRGPLRGHLRMTSHLREPNEFVANQT